GPVCAPLRLYRTATGGGCLRQPPRSILERSSRMRYYRTVDMDRTPRDLLDHLIPTRPGAGLSPGDPAPPVGTWQSALARVEATGADPRLSTVERYAAALNSVLVAKGKGVVRADAYSIDAIEELMEASFANSQRLVEDASLLLEADRFPTAYLVAVLAGEGASETPMLV